MTLLHHVVFAGSLQVEMIEFETGPKWKNKDKNTKARINVNRGGGVRHLAIWRLWNPHFRYVDGWRNSLNLKLKMTARLSDLTSLFPSVDLLRLYESISFLRVYLYISLWSYLLSPSMSSVFSVYLRVSVSLLHSLVPSSQPICVSLCLCFVLFSSYLSICCHYWICPFLFCSDLTCMYVGVNIPISGFSANHRLDMEILPDCMSLGDPKMCDNKIEALLSRSSTLSHHLYLHSERWIGGSHTKYVRPSK